MHERERMANTAEFRHLSHFLLDEEEGTCVSMLRDRALALPNQAAFTFLIDGEQEGECITYGELDRRARALGAVLQSHASQGERALLIFNTGNRFIEAFFGCLYAGVIAVPVYPPANSRHVPRIQSIAVVSGATLVLTEQEIHSRIQPHLSDAPSIACLPWVSIDAVRSGSERAWRDPTISSTDLAFLQFTSGSTSDPKGVMVTHGNLLYNLQDMATSWFRYSEGGCLVTWLPAFHDMGLISGLLLPLYIGMPCYAMTPFAFIQRPVRWLRAISRYQATHSVAPNFAFDLCVRKVTPEQRAELDLSHWIVAGNGSEPVQQGTLKRFAQTFKECGFAWSAFGPGYGLAEATLAVTTTPPDEEPVFLSVLARELERHRVVETSDMGVGVRTLTGCGKTNLNTRIVTVDPETCVQCAPDVVGEIWVSGPTVTSGYWEREDLTEQVFNARLADTGEGPYLRTGDLGFVKDGQLYVTGRIKDLIIIDGANHYPQDIELTVQHSHPSLRLGCGVAFSIDAEDGEQLVVVQEVRQEFVTNLDVETERKAIVAAISVEHDLLIKDVVLVCPGTIQKTSSGKLMRRACRALYLDGAIERLNFSK
jgi:acyl-CoA synthetase (AMP-forming)/AMP-acid ligase II